MQQIILPYPINERKLLNGSIEYVDFGSKTFKINVPPNMYFGKKIRLKGLAGHIDESFAGEDLLLLLKRELETFTSIRKDVIMELPIDLNSLKRGQTKRINIMDRKYDVKIPNTSKYGQMLRMKNLAEIMNGGYPGDVLLKIAEQPNFNRGILHKIIGNFVGFETPVSERKFKIVFKLPWLFEFSDEWIFRFSESNVHGRYT